MTHFVALCYSDNVCFQVAKEKSFIFLPDAEI